MLQFDLSSMVLITVCRTPGTAKHDMPSQLPGEGPCSKLLRALLILEIGTQSPDLQAYLNSSIKGLQICAAGSHLRLSSSSKSLDFKDTRQVGPRCRASSHSLQIRRNIMHENKIRFCRRVELAMQASGPQHSTPS